MISKFLTKIWVHIFLWTAMLFYIAFSPDVFTLMFTKNGRPIQVDHVIMVESDQIAFAIEGFEPHVKDGEKLYKLYGWALIVPQEGSSLETFVREISLVSDSEQYFFAIEPVSRNLELPGRFANLEVDFNTLGFSALIAEDVIKPGEYRIGVVFRNNSSSSVLYWDKPAHYLVKTPNTLRLDGK